MSFFVLFPEGGNGKGKGGVRWGGCWTRQREEEVYEYGVGTL